MTKQKPIKLRLGLINQTAEELGVSVVTIRKALRYDCDSDMQNMIRAYVKKQGYIKRF